MSGQDIKDSTSVKKPEKSYLLSEEPNVDGITVGLPQVGHVTVTEKHKL